jgi:hypothetical protein
MIVSEIEIRAVSISLRYEIWPVVDSVADCYQKLNEKRRRIHLAMVRIPMM